MIDNLEDLQAAVGGGGDDKKITNEQRQSWNDYVGWLKKRGIAGDPRLDKNNLGKNMLAQYIKENPKTSLTTDMVSPIQHDFANYRQYMIQQLRDKKAMITDSKSPDGRYVEPNEDLSNYMKELSVVDNFPGSRTTSHTFPSAYLKTFEDGKLTSTEDKGFATTNQ